MEAAALFIIDTWPELIALAVIAAGLIVLSRRLRQRHDVFTHGPDDPEGKP